MAEGTRMLQRRATEAVWNTSDYVLASGEIGVTTDTGIIKVGNGTSPWTELDPAFDSHYLPILGKAADSELLDGIGSESFVKVIDSSVNPTNDSYVKRTADGGIKGTDATEATELTSLQQMTAAILASKASLVSRSLTAAAILDLADADSIVYVDNSSLTAQIQVTIPPTSSVAYPVGTIIRIVAIGAGGAKLVPGSGVGITGSTNVMPGGGSILLIKRPADGWRGLDMNVGKRQPSIKYRCTVTGTNYGSGYVFVPWDTLDSNETYNPDNEWFTIPAAGISTARRIIINKDGQYTFSVAMSTNGGGGLSFCRVASMTADNSTSGMKMHGVLGMTGMGLLSVPLRVTAGQSFGVHHGGAAGNVGLADAENSGSDPHFFKIVRVSD